MLVAERVQQQTATPMGMWNSVSGWLLALLLTYFVTDGHLSFRNPQGNSALAAQGGVGVGDSDTSVGVLIHISICLLVLYFVYPHLKNIFHTFLRLKSVAILAVLPLLSVLWSVDRSATVKAGAYLLMSMVFAVYFATNFSSERQMQLLWMTSWITVLASIALAILAPNIGVDHLTGRENEWQGLFVGKNNCATSIFFILMPCLLMPARNSLIKTMKYVSLALVLLLIFMTHSITGWIITAIYLLFISTLKLLGNFNPRDRRAIAALSSIGVVMVAAVAFANFKSLLEVFGRDLSFSGRTGIWSALLVSIMKHPLLGYGFRAFWQGMHGESANVVVAIHWIVGYAHNGFLGLWVELGALALFLFAVTFVRAIRDTASCLWVRRLWPVDWYLGVLLFTLLYNLSEASLMYEFNFVWFLYIVSCVSLRSMVAERGKTMTPVASLTSSEELVSQAS